MKNEDAFEALQNIVFESGGEDEKNDADDKIFGIRLGFGEKMIWSGESEEKSDLMESGVKFSKILVPILVMILSVMFMTVCFISGSPWGAAFLPVTAAAVFSIKRYTAFPKHYYAVTNKRVLIYDGKEQRTLKLCRIRQIKVRVSSRNIGSMVFELEEQEESEEITAPRKFRKKKRARNENGIYGISEPYKVSEMIYKLSEKERNAG